MRARAALGSDAEQQRRQRDDDCGAAELTGDADDAVSHEIDAAVITIHTPVLVASSVDGAEAGSAQADCLLHLLPCHIRANAPAAVSRFFQPQQLINPLLPPAAGSAADAEPAAAASAAASSPSPGSYIPSALPSTTSYLTQPVCAAPASAAAAAALASSCWYTGAFRGREMTGEKLRLPADCVGLVLSRGREAQSSSWRVMSRFQSLFLWHRDQDWRGDDRSLLRQTMTDWPSIAAALHG